MPFSSISSFSNQQIKQTVALHQSSVRRETGLIIIEGERELVQSLNSKVVWKKIFFCAETLKDSYQKFLEKVLASVELYQVPEKIFEKISYGERQEGFLVVAEAPKIVQVLPEKPKAGIWLILEAIEKPGNLGAILRTADGAGVAGIILVDPVSLDLFHPNILRSSQGSIFYHSLYLSSTDQTLAWLKQNKIDFYALTPEAKQDLYQTQFSKTSAFVFGTEHEGLSATWMKEARPLRIPMQGKIDALNVSVSVAVCLYEGLRQQTKALSSN